MAMKFLKHPNKHNTSWNVDGSDCIRCNYILIWCVLFCCLFVFFFALISTLLLFNAYIRKICMVWQRFIHIYRWSFVSLITSRVFLFIEEQNNRQTNHAKMIHKYIHFYITIYSMLNLCYWIVQCSAFGATTKNCTRPHTQKFSVVRC